jgi:hypothetical protein
MEAPMPATIRPGEGHLGCSRPYAAYVQPEQMAWEKLSAPRAAASTLFFPDISNFQAGLTIQPKTVAVIAKASEGATFSDALYGKFKTQAAKVGAVFSAYHFLWSSSPAEVRHVVGIVGKTPLMIDAENTHVKTTVAMIVAFAKAYRAAGGVVWGVYLPRWYWQGTLGSPSLAPLKAAGLALVSSNYTTYSDGGPGWGAYGGVTPRQWQYTDALSYGGQRVDFNAFRGTVADLRALWKGTNDQEDDMQLTDQVPLPKWLTTAYPDLADTSKRSVSTLLASGYGHARVAETAAKQATADVDALTARVDAMATQVAMLGDPAKLAAALKAAGVGAAVDQAELEAALRNVLGSLDSK